MLNSLEISAVSYPATEVGGDYFDYFEISSDKIGLFICDVSGHGVASGLLLSGLRSCMHLILEDDSNPKSVMEKLNRMIRKTQNRKMFVTAIFAAIDLKNNRCTLFNAGHMPPYRISGDSGEIFRIRKHGMALGVMDTVEIENLNGEVSFDFQPGDKIIFYTDGVNESSNNNSVEYGSENLEVFFNEHINKNPRELISSLVNDIKKFTGDIPQKDDLTIMIAERKP
jgi:phosphoserine phosphatase RsbU/P